MLTGYNDKMKIITMGVLAHVDAGKTTLSEALLYLTGTIRSLGRVDHKDAFLDTDEQERERGITIFSKQAEIVFPDGRMMLLDTPGHVDFSAEMERTLQVLDCAVLVVSGKDGVQGHTATLWKLLKKYNIPVFIFVNKMDLEGTDRTALMGELVRVLDSGCVDFTDGWSKDADALSMCSEKLMEEILENGSASKDSIAEAVAGRKLFPCFFGSALKLQGVDEFIKALWELSPQAFGSGRKARNAGAAEFGARVYKITRDPKGTRLTHMKITSGTLKVKDLINGEKAEQIRIYSGDKFRTADVAEAGSICAAAGPVKTYAGQGVGVEKDSGAAVIEPVMMYSIILNNDEDPYVMYTKLRQLEEEDPQLRIVWNEHSQKIQLQLMGEVQLEILKNIVKTRFGVDIEFGQGCVAYRETITRPVIGSGHFEPLRHYAEVHLLMEPGEPGSGIVIGTACSADDLDTNWQRLIMTHIAEKNHIGTLAGFPITDMKITVAAGKAHKKHTEGGDFRQATYRAIRQGLMKARRAGACMLLEPWYEFRLEIPADAAGRAMSDIQRMGGSFETPLMSPDSVVIEGKAPADELKDYPSQLNSYTKGFGRMMYSPCGYRPCHDQESVLQDIAYEPEFDIENTADSVFCSHGGGYNVRWDEADTYFHIQVSADGFDEAYPAGRSDDDEWYEWYKEFSMNDDEELEAAAQAAKQAALRQSSSKSPQTAKNGASQSLSRAEDEELKRIFERTYGEGSSEGNRHTLRPQARVIKAQPHYSPTKPAVILPEYIFVDGYNVIFAWEDLKALAKVNIDSAREALLDILVNYQGYRKCRMTVVFDAYKIKGGVRHEEKRGDIDVVFTKEDETADTYIERTTYGMDKKYMIRVVSSDRLEQQMILGNGAFRVSAAEFKAEIDAVKAEINEIIEKNAGKVKKETRRGVDIIGADGSKQQTVK